MHQYLSHYPLDQKLSFNEFYNYWLESQLFLMTIDQRYIVLEAFI